MRGNCSRCKQAILRSEFLEHVCPPNPDDIFEELKAEVDQLRQENAKQKSEID